MPGGAFPFFLQERGAPRAFLREIQWQRAALFLERAAPGQLARAVKTALATLPAVSMPPAPSSTTTAKA